MWFKGMKCIFPPLFLLLSQWKREWLLCSVVILLLILRGLEMNREFKPRFNNGVPMVHQWFLVRSWIWAWWPYACSHGTPLVQHPGPSCGGLKPPPHGRRWQSLEPQGTSYGTSGTPQGHLRASSGYHVHQNFTSHDRYYTSRLHGTTSKALFRACSKVKF